MRLPSALLTLLAVAAVALVPAGTAPAETIFAYYPFDTATSGVTPDATSNANDLTLGGTTPATIDAGSMFGDGAAKSTAVTGFARMDDGDLDFDTDYTKLSVSLWAKQTDGWTGGETKRERFLTGKYNTGDNRGWVLNVAGGPVNQIRFAGFETNLQASDNLALTTTMTSALDADAFHHIVATFDASGTDVATQFGIYVDGIRQGGLVVTSKSVPPPTRLDNVTGNNANAFQVLNRGATATSSSSGGGFVGSIDDYFIATGDVLTDQQVALIHGLGRLAGVSMGSGSSVGDEIGDVLAAYNAQSSATAGGQTWCYGANVGAGPIGAIGGTVAGGDAYIVLGTDGSGVMLVPEPGTLALLGAGLAGLLAFAPRKRR